LIKLSYRSDRQHSKQAVLIPGGKAGVWVVGLLGFGVTALSMALSLVPTEDVSSKLGFEIKVIGGSAVAIVIGLLVYWRGARSKVGAK